MVDYGVDLSLGGVPAQIFGPMLSSVLYTWGPPALRSLTVQPSVSPSKLGAAKDKGVNLAALGVDLYALGVDHDDLGVDLDGLGMKPCK